SKASNQNSESGRRFSGSNIRTRRRRSVGLRPASSSSFSASARSTDNAASADSTRTLAVPRRRGFLVPADFTPVFLDRSIFVLHNVEAWEPVQELPSDTPTGQSLGGRL